MYFDDLRHEHIVQEPTMQLSDFVADIGGLIGVFLGTSFLSFVELVELAVKCLAKIILHFNYNQALKSRNIFNSKWRHKSKEEKKF